MHALTGLHSSLIKRLKGFYFLILKLFTKCYQKRFVLHQLYRNGNGLGKLTSRAKVNLLTRCRNK